MDKEIIAGIIREVKSLYEKKDKAHDWSHIDRVTKLAQQIASKEGADQYIVTLGALLHDISDWKDNSGDSSVGGVEAKKFLQKFEIESSIQERVAEIVEKISFKGNKSEDQKSLSLEAKVVQDADRLDAMGAIGVARCFAYSASKGRPIYDPTIPYDIEAFSRQGSLTAINHFYEKLLLIGDLMNTETGMQIAKERHQFLEAFLTQFFKEWEGK